MCPIIQRELFRIADVIADSFCYSVLRFVVEPKATRYEEDDAFRTVQIDDFRTPSFGRKLIFWIAIHTELLSDK